MEQLTKAEEPIMQALWKLEQAFVKDIIAQLPDSPKPPYNTVSSVVRVLVQKGYVSFKAYGKTYQYFPLISKTHYREESLKQLLTYFDSSPLALATYLVEEVLNRKETQQLRKLLNDD